MARPAALSVRKCWPYTRPSAFEGSTPSTATLLYTNEGDEVRVARQFGLPLASTGTKQVVLRNGVSPFGQLPGFGLSAPAAVMICGASPKMVFVVHVVVGNASVADR